MRPFRDFAVILGLMLLLAPSLARAQAKQPACGPDHAILYKRAVGLLDQAEKKLTARYTAEAKALVKESNSLFSILQKECGPAQRQRVLTPKELQQEAINKRLTKDENAQGERLEKSAAEKFKKATQIEPKQPELYKKYMREAQTENEQAQKRYIKAEIYSLRTQQMLFRFLGK